MRTIARASSAAARETLRGAAERTVSEGPAKGQPCRRSLVTATLGRARKGGHYASVVVKEDGFPRVYSEPSRVCELLVARFREWMGGRRRDGTVPRYWYDTTDLDKPDDRGRDLRRSITLEKYSRPPSKKVD